MPSIYLSITGLTLTRPSPIPFVLVCCYLPFDPFRLNLLVGMKYLGVNVAAFLSVALVCFESISLCLYLFYSLLYSSIFKKP